MFTKLKSDFRELITDDSSKLSLSKTIYCFAMITSTLFCIKLIALGGFSPEYMAIYLGIAGGQHISSKWIDSKTTNQVIPQ